MIGYYHDTILINGRCVQFKDILNQTAAVLTEFENDTLSFIHQWLSEEQTFYFQTSGSTGEAKKVAFNRDQIIQSADATIKALGLLPSHSSLVCLNTKYMAGKMMLVRSLLNNMKLIIVEPNSNPLKKIDANTRVDFAAFVPLQIQNMFDDHKVQQLNRIRSILIGGAPLNSTLRKRIKEELKTNVFATYGMTETITHIALENLGDDNNVYRTLPGVRIRKDERGCIVIETPFLKEPVLTNDIVDMISDQSFKWLGRWDNVINTGGIKILPEILEEKIQPIFQRLNIKNRFFVTGFPNETLGSEIVLIIEAISLALPIRSEIRGEMAKKLSKFEIPKQIIFMARFIETPTGKINRLKTVSEL